MANKTEEKIFKRLADLYSGRLKMEASYLASVRFNTTNAKKNAEFLASEEWYKGSIIELEYLISSEEIQKLRVKANYGIVDLNP